MRVSIIVPTYNRSLLLVEAIHSILGQEHEDMEIIVVDDGSTDDTVQRFEEYSNSLLPTDRSKLTFLRQSNSGAPVARNLGFDKSSGELIVFMDSDDLLTRDGLSRGIKHIAQSGCDYAYLPVQLCNEVGCPVQGALVGSPCGNFPRDVAGYHWQTMGAIYKREVVKNVGPWNTELSGSQDWEYQARVKLSGAQGNFVNATIGFWRQHAQGRIGATAYNHKYVASVELACIAIGSEAERRGVLDRELRSRLSRRLLIHAIEAGAAGISPDRSRLLQSARRFTDGFSGTLAALIPWIRVRMLDQIIYKAISR